MSFVPKYPKINTLWQRDEKRKHVIVPGEYSDLAHQNIKYWHVSEKVDGTNIRVVYRGFEETVEFRGRTDNAEIPPKLLAYLQETFTIERLKPVLGPLNMVVLYGEGYGPGIQKCGKRYRDDVSFIMFDAWFEYEDLEDQGFKNIRGWWLEPERVQKLGEQLCIDVAPEVPVERTVVTIDQAVEFLRLRPPSKIAVDESLPIEGIVARAWPQVLDREGAPVMWKLKVKDYEKLSRQQAKEAEE